MRLDQYLVKKYPQYSRSFLKSQIKAGNVLVNGKIKKPSYILKENDKIEINFTAPEKSELQPNPDIKLNIVFEDNNVIVIDKPAGLSIHPAQPGQNNTLVNGLLAYYPDIKSVGDTPEIRPGIVHRLDKDTSGLMAIAKNNEAFDWLKKQFAERKVIKKYLALVIGEIKKGKGIISKAISRAKGSIKRTVTPEAGAREAVTFYKVLKHYPTCHPEPKAKDLINEKNHADEILHGVYPERSRRIQNDKIKYTLVEAEPKTGRTHQIRIHLASIGHPIAGDKLYGFKRQSPLAGSKRQFLHASYLKFMLPDGSMIELKSKLPEDLKTIINALSLNKNNKSKLQNPNDKQNQKSQRQNFWI